MVFLWFGPNHDSLGMWGESVLQEPGNIVPISLSLGHLSWRMLLMCLGGQVKVDFC